MRVLKPGMLAMVCLLWSFAPAVRADYLDEVLEDEPIAYWRLGDEDVLDGAFNSAETIEDPAVLNGVYAGDPLLEEEGLLFDDPDTAVRFNGTDSEIQVLDSLLLNTGVYEGKTVELWFQAEEIDTVQRMLWEQGGSTRGIHVYVQEVDGDPTIFMIGLEPE